MGSSSPWWLNQDNRYYVIRDDLVKGRLIPVLDDWELPRPTINFAFQTRLHLPAKVRLFMDAMVAERFRKHDVERLWAS